MNHTIAAATNPLTGIRAAVTVIDLVSIVTIFAALDDAIAANRVHPGTVSVAAIAGIGIAVITHFEFTANHTVTAGGTRAGSRTIDIAATASVSEAIVTKFEFRAGLTITTSRTSAGSRAVSVAAAASIRESVIAGL